MKTFTRMANEYLKDQYKTRDEAFWNWRNHPDSKGFGLHGSDEDLIRAFNAGWKARKLLQYKLGETHEN